MKKISNPRPEEVGAIKPPPPPSPPPPDSIEKESLTKADIARKNRRRGKRVQKRIAKEMDARNVGIFGGEDAEHPIFSIEAKSKVKFVGEKFIIQAENNCPEGKIPIVILHIVGKSYDKDIVMIRIDKFKGLI